ncbi:12723_t:CDS:2, partial [Funneliformis geosporum]
LDSLSQKVYSLEAFGDCLAKLEKYDKKRSPASVSFRYMVETIKAFLDGQKYGEFQAKAKKELEEKLKNSKNDQAKEKKEIVEKLRDNNSDIQINEENIKRYR